MRAWSKSELIGFIAVALGTACLLAADSAVSAEHCRTVRGRMGIWNGAPTVRIWVVGTKRILGVHGENEPFDQLPSNIRDRWHKDTANSGLQLFGDFRVCALEPSHPGWMQMVRVERATHLSWSLPD